VVVAVEMASEILIGRARGHLTFPLAMGLDTRMRELEVPSKHRLLPRVPWHDVGSGKAGAHVSDAAGPVS
jgi:hypothetical protein